MNFVDDEAGIVFLEDLFTLDTNLANTKAKDVASIDDFLAGLALPIMVSSPCLTTESKWDTTIATVWCGKMCPIGSCS
jgi:hypothetical protein